MENGADQQKWERPAVGKLEMLGGPLLGALRVGDTGGAVCSTKFIPFKSREDSGKEAAICKVAHAEDQLRGVGEYYQVSFGRINGL